MHNEKKDYLANNPIKDIMNAALTNLKSLIDVETVIGTPIITNEGTTIIPLSKVTMGFVTGGGEFNNFSNNERKDYPFAGGSGAGLSLVPIGFLIETEGQIKVLTTKDDNDSFLKTLELLPKITKKIFEKFQKPEA